MEWQCGIWRNSSTFKMTLNHGLGCFYWSEPTGNAECTRYFSVPVRRFEVIFGANLVQNSNLSFLKKCNFNNFLVYQTSNWDTEHPVKLKMTNFQKKFKSHQHILFFFFLQVWQTKQSDRLVSPLCCLVRQNLGFLHDLKKVLAFKPKVNIKMLLAPPVTLANIILMLTHLSVNAKNCSLG